MKCAIKWIDVNGQPTPDTNDAIGFATCHFAAIKRADGSVCAAHDSPPLAICAEHARRLAPNWSFVGIDAVAK